MKFEPTKAKLTASCEVPGILLAMAFDAKRGQVYGAGTDWSVYSVDANAEKPKAQKRWTNHENYVSATMLVAGSVVSAGYDGRIIWTDAQSGKQTRAVDAHDGWVRDLALLPDGKQLVSIGDDMLVKIWNTETGKLLKKLEGHAKETPQGYATALYGLAVTPDGKHIASGDRIGEVCIWEAATGNLIGKLQAPTFYTYDAKARVRSIGGIRCLRYSPDGSTLAIGGIGKVTNVDGFVGPCRVELWDWQQSKRLSVLQDKHKAVLNDIQFHPTANCLIAAGGGDSGGILAFWDLKSQKLIHKAKLKGHAQRIALSEDLERLLAVGHGGFQVWSCKAG